MKLKDWKRLDIFTGINIFIDWCEENNVNHSNPETFEEFIRQLKK